MSQADTIVDLGQMALSSGEGRTIEAPVRLAPLSLGEHRYSLGDKPRVARVDVSRTNAGYALRLRLDADVEGPCMRCLEPAELHVEVEAREVDQPRDGDEELESPYLDDNELDLGSWAQEAVALAVPARILCRADCAGLCAVCGASLNDADPAEHEHPSGPDSRWAKLDELRRD